MSRFICDLLPLFSHSLCVLCVSVTLWFPFAVPANTPAHHRELPHPLPNPSHRPLHQQHPPPRSARPCTDRAPLRTPALPKGFVFLCVEIWTFPRVTTSATPRTTATSPFFRFTGNSITRPSSNARHHPRTGHTKHPGLPGGGVHTVAPNSITAWFKSPYRAPPTRPPAPTRQPPNPLQNPSPNLPKPYQTATKPYRFRSRFAPK